MARGGTIKMKMSDGAEIGVYRVGPKGARRGGLVLIQEIFGISEHITTISDEFADDGYEVLAPSLFDREQPGFQAGYSPEEMQRAIRIARQDHPSRSLSRMPVPASAR
jgi:carboxymethylenebutenolidase